MASSPITSWQRGGEAMETVTDFILRAPKSLWFMTGAMKLKDSCSLEEKLWPTQSILKSRNITLPTKVHLVKAMVFPVVVYGCESCTMKKAELQGIVDFELWCLRRLLRVPWITRRSNQSILKETSPNIHWKDWCWSWNCNTLATWCIKLTHWETPWCWESWRWEEKGTTEDDIVGWHHWMNGHEFEQTRSWWSHPTIS